MSQPMSALEHIPTDFIREVSPDAIDFYVNGMSGIYMPSDFTEAHQDITDVKFWQPEDRLYGKFGRFKIVQYEEDDTTTELDDVLVMGTTIGLQGMDRYNHLESLRHYMLNQIVGDVLEELEIPLRTIMDMEIFGADYGTTRISLGNNDTPSALNVSGRSIDFGRADATGRQKTCDLFAKLLGSDIKIENSDPKPSEFEDVIQRA